MDPMLNEESRQESKASPVRRRRRKNRTIPLPAFLTHLGTDVRWYYDVRLWSPLILLLLILALLPGKKEVQEPVEEPPEISMVETQPTEDPTPTEEAVIAEAAALARLADSVGSGRSDNLKNIIMWVAVNRSEDRSNG